jgi:hypothetical protein
MRAQRVASEIALNLTGLTAHVGACLREDTDKKRTVAEIAGWLEQVDGPRHGA